MYLEAVLYIGKPEELENTINLSPNNFLKNLPTHTLIFFLKNKIAEWGYQ